MALIPVAATAFYYLLPPRLQARSIIQFAPQLLAYGALATWAIGNTDVIGRLGMRRAQIPGGVRWGLPIGIILGLLNVSVMLWVVPRFGGDILFLADTPHARVPAALMLPWLIILIAVGVELNFRGFLLGRLLVLFGRNRQGLNARIRHLFAIVVSALIFSFDPFMVTTFQHLHWIALWDGIVWGMMWLRTSSLYATIVAHTVEVIVMYTVLKIVLS